MKSKLYVLIAFILLLTNSCKREQLEKEIAPPSVTATSNVEFLKKIEEQLKNKSLSHELHQKISNHQIDWSQNVHYGSVGDTIGHLLVPVFHGTGEVESYIRIAIAGKDSVADAQLINIQNEFITNKKVAEKAFAARDLLAMSKKGIRLNKNFSTENAKKAIVAYAKSIKNQGPKIETSLSSNVALNNSYRFCYMSFQIWYYINTNEPSPPSPAAINAHFVGRLNYYLSNMTRYYWPLSTPGGLNHLTWDSQLIDYTTLQSNISQIWNNETVWQFGGPWMITTYNEEYIDNGCDPDPNEGGGGNPGGGDPNDPDNNCTSQEDAEIKLNNIFATFSAVNEDREITDVGTPYLENQIQTRKKQFKWAFYKGSLTSYFTFKVWAFAEAVQKYNTAQSKWLWHSFTFGGTTMEGAVPFEMTHTLDAQPSITINTPKTLANIAFPYTVKLSVECGPFKPSKTMSYTSVWNNITVDGN